MYTRPTGSNGGPFLPLCTHKTYNMYIVHSSSQKQWWSRSTTVYSQNLKYVHTSNQKQWWSRSTTVYSQNLKYVHCTQLQPEAMVVPFYHCVLTKPKICTYNIHTYTRPAKSTGGPALQLCTHKTYNTYVYRSSQEYWWFHSTTFYSQNLKYVHRSSQEYWWSTLPHFTHKTSNMYTGPARSTGVPALPQCTHKT